MVSRSRNKTHKNKTHKNKTHKKTNKVLNGGKFLDKGGFGCVITPALPCNSFNKKLNLNNYVSKIVSG